VWRATTFPQAIVRDALRATPSLKLDDPRGRGGREAFAAAIGDVNRRVREALADLERDPSNIGR